MCCHFVLKPLASLQALKNTSALKVLSGQFLKLCELDFRNGTVRNVAGGMIPVCMEFMYVYVLLQGPDRVRRADSCRMHSKQ
jgi:hypothetical protein